MHAPTLTDVSHATQAAADLFASYFQAKSSRAVAPFLHHFAEAGVTYVDATLGWYLADHSALTSTLTQIMPNWGEGISYATRLLGDEHSGIVAVTDTPELFGAEVRVLSAYTAVAGKVTRFVDYWDARQFGVERAAAMATPDDAFPLVFGEDRVAETAGPRMKEAVARWTDALTVGDVDTAVAVLAPDVVFEDMTLHLQLLGPQAVAHFLRAAAQDLPYGIDARVALVLGDDVGGGYEWRTARGGAVGGDSPRARRKWCGDTSDNRVGRVQGEPRNDPTAAGGQRERLRAGVRAPTAMSADAASGCAGVSDRLCPGSHLALPRADLPGRCHRTGAQHQEEP